MTHKEYVDDSSLADATSLWRRIPPWHFVYDANLQRRRPPQGRSITTLTAGPCPWSSATSCLQQAESRARS